MLYKTKKAKNLFDLIHSLTKSEKRYFKLCSKFQDGDNSYLIVFDVLNKQKVYNEERLIKKLIKTGHLNKCASPENLSGNLRSQKSYTSQLIMRSLRLFHKQQGTGEQKVKTALGDANILFDKGLFQDGCVELKKAKEIAIKYQQTLDLITITRKELELTTSLEKKDTLKKVKKLHRKLEEYEAQMKIQNLYSLFYSEVAIHYRNFGRFKSQSKDILHLETQLNHQLFNEKNAKITFKTHYAYYLIHGYLHLIKNDISTAKFYFKQVLNIWNDNQHFIDEMPKTYIGLISNYLNVCSISNEEDPQFLDYINIIKNQKHQNQHQRTAQLQETLFLKLRYAMNFSLFNQASIAVEEIETKMDLFIDKIPASRKLAFYYNLIIFYFLKEDFSAAQNYIFQWNYLLDRNEHREDLKAKIKLVELILEYESKRRSDVFTRVRSISCHLKYKDMFDKLATILLKHILLIETSKEREKPLKMAYFLQDLAELKEEIGQNNVGGIGIIELELWLKTRKYNLENQDGFRFQPLQMHQLYQKENMATANHTKEALNILV